jgi:hypothetical protein
MTDWSVEDEIAQVAVGRPHIVLLGAGASRAAFPNGERNGRLLPLMSDFIDVIGIKSLLETKRANPGERNFEDSYSALALNPKMADLRNAVDSAVLEYFSSLELPDAPTLYDYLILSLRPKDVIATFNWDPFLIQAATRRRHLTEPPKLMFLHGNVLEGYCKLDDNHGCVGATCSRCGRQFEPVPLLYPIRQKNYEQDLAIRSAWTGVKSAFQNAFMVTVFGYSAPVTDGSAIDLLRAAWGAQRNLEQFEIIDVREGQAWLESWKGFTDPGGHHYEIHSAFEDSWIVRHPRRSGEAWHNQYIEAIFIDDNHLPMTESWDELYGWFEPLLRAEKVSIDKP